MMYKVLNNMAPEYLRDLLYSVSEIHGRSYAQLRKSCYPFRFLVRQIMKNLLLSLGPGNGIPCHYMQEKLSTIQSFKTYVSSK